MTADSFAGDAPALAGVEGRAVASVSPGLTSTFSASSLRCVLDVAGGRGDVCFELTTVRSIPSVLLEPRRRSGPFEGRLEGREAGPAPLIWRRSPPRHRLPLRGGREQPVRDDQLCRDRCLAGGRASASPERRGRATRVCVTSRV